MTAKTAAQIGSTTWYLTKILHIEGSCDHCGRTLKHLYEVVNPDGKEMTVGRGCVKKLTGWTLSYAQAEQALRSALRCAEIDRRRAIVAAAYPELAEAFAALENAAKQMRSEGYDIQGAYGRVGRAVSNQAALFSQATTEDFMWREGGYSTWQEYLARNV